MLVVSFGAALFSLPSAGAEPCRPGHAVILLYHHVSAETPASTSVTPELFASHLDYLDRQGFRVAALPDVAEALRAGADLPDSTVVLTFDDGYRSVYEEAFPLLRARNWPFTVFVCPGAIDGREGPVMTWDQLRDIRDAGGTVANHGLHHGFVSRPRKGEDGVAHRKRLEKEWLAARDRLVEELGSSPDLLAYPYGEYSPMVQFLVETLGWTAFGQQSGAAGPRSDMTCLPRFPMAGPFAAMEDFGLKVASLPWPTTMALRPDPGVDPLAAEAPVLTLVVEPGCLGGGEVNAFAPGQGRIPVEWLDRESGFLRIQAPRPLPPGRSRYNVTAPSPEAGRWFWFSQTWIIGTEHDH